MIGPSSTIDDQDVLLKKILKESDLTSVFFELLQPLFLFVGREGRIISATKRLEAILGYSVTGKELVSLALTSREQQRLQEVFNSVLEENGVLESKGHQWGNETSPLSFALRLKAVSEGVLIFCVDQSEQLVLENHLAQAQKMESIGELAAGVAHEINTPMQYIGDNVAFLRDGTKDLLEFIAQIQPVCDEKNYCELAEKADLSYLTEEIPAALEQAQEGVKRVTRIVRSLKAFAHPGKGTILPTNLIQMIDDAITVAKNEWKYVANVETNYDPDLIEIPCNVGEMSQVILNMLINAAHAVGEAIKVRKEEKGKIRISTYQEGDDVVITIEDNGLGIPPDLAKRIFEPFFTTKDVGVGTGQGLSLAYRVVVDQHQGKIDLESSPGCTCFFVRLPLQQKIEGSDGC